MVRMEGQLLNDIIQTTNGLGHTAIHMIIELVGHLRVMVFPNFEKPHINYWPEDFPNGIPEFKSAGRNYMKNYFNTEEDNRFKNNL